MGGSTLQCAQAQQHVITINWFTLNRAPYFWCVRFLCCDGLSQIMTHIIMSGSLAPPLEKSCIRPCLQPLMLIFWCIWRENMRAGQVTAGWIDIACGPDIMLKFTGCRGPDRQSSRAGFGPRAGLCRPLLYKHMLSTWNYTRFISTCACVWQVFSHLASVKTSEKLMASVADADRANPVVQTTINGSQLH